MGSSDVAPDTDLLPRWLALDTCAVADALDSLKLPAAVSGLLPLAGVRRIGGRVLTVRLGSRPPVGGSRRHLCTAAIEAAGVGDVIVIEQRTGLDAAGWGGVLSLAAKLKGIAGVVIDGPARDIDEAAAFEFTVYARCATARTARGRVYEQETNGPINVGELTVRAGDYVLADRSAVVFAPVARLAEVVHAAERIVRKERLMMEALRSGQAVTAVMGVDYETMLDGPGGTK